MLEHIHVCDSCKKEHRSEVHRLGMLGEEAPKGWAHVDLRVTVPAKPDTALSDMIDATDEMLKAADLPKKKRKMFAKYFEQIGTIGPPTQMCMDHWYLCDECTPKLLAFFVTMNLKERPVSQFGLGTVDLPPEIGPDDEQS